LLQTALFCVVERSRSVSTSLWKVSDADESHPLSAGLVATRVS
jgi:hypothetical protein